ncbi:MAG: hypothetical protein JXA64_07275, partial [Candidatus Fermentibacteraceae bacterium]|nr:hypothetical protein [Candidatus Fermentibacteraceae bacterium]
MGILSWIVALFILAMINFATGISAIGRFIATCPRITGPGDLSDLKAMVRKQMYRALLQIVLLGGM